jgi:MYXO-CTERM domain-containing protein
MVADGSTPCSESEGAERAVDGMLHTKWCSQGSEPTLHVDLGGEYIIDQVLIHHAEAGGESAELNSRDFSLSTRLDDGEWEVLSDISGNTNGLTQITVDPVHSTELTLRLTAPTQAGDGAARIYELEVFGTLVPQAPVDGDGTGGAGLGGADSGTGGMNATIGGDGPTSTDGTESGGDDAGCSCGTTRSSTPPVGALLLLLGLAGAVVLRRRAPDPDGK